MENNVIDVKEFETGYGNRQVLYNITFGIEKESTLNLIIGPNGSGKSTLLKTISGLLKPWKGKILFQDKNITFYPTHQRIKMGIGYLRQTENIFPKLTVRENLQIAGYYLNKTEFNTSLERILLYFPEFKEKLNKRAGLLSGGERQFLAISMILLSPKKLLLLDEPIAGLDPKHGRVLLQKILDIKNDEKLTIIMVEHNLKLLIPVSDTVIGMDNGKIILIERDKTLLQNYNFIKRIFFGDNNLKR